MLGDHGVLRKFYDNTHEIAQGRLWRTYQPSPADLKRWKACGIRTVVNLRGDRPSGFLFLEEEACRALDMKLVTFRVYSRDAPSKDILYNARKLFQDIDYPAIIHCKSGADRAGLMATLFLFFEKGMPLDKAMEQLSWRYGHVKQGKTGVIDYALQQYIDYARSAGKSLTSISDFFDWVDAHYDPAKTKDSFLGSWWGNMLTETILRRE
ncbi:MAG: fused DSP-PTPase phosphatase/NAD kinase-like protein [Hyphococcus sp.]